MLMYENKVLYCILLYCVYSKFIEYFPDYLSALSRALLRFFWTTFVETAVFYTLVFRELAAMSIVDPEANEIRLPRFVVLKMG